MAVLRDGKPRLIIRALKDLGFVENGGTKHLKMIKTDENGKQTHMVTVPIHGVIKREMVDRIRKNAGIDKKTFYAYKF